MPLPPAARFIRYIYNRVVLENATVRAAAVSALARVGPSGRVGLAAAAAAAVARPTLP